MLTSTVIIVLREVLEASYLVSLLLIISYNVKLGYRWLYASLLTGALGASVYAIFLSEISLWFDYSGQEIINACIQIGIFVGITFIIIQLTKPLISASKLSWVMALIVALAITREGSELVVYFSSRQQHVSITTLGAFIVLGIGLSLGALFYYGIGLMRANTAIIFSKTMLTLTASGLLSQGLGFLIQADIIHAQQAAWDIDHWLAESSITGQLLYALIAYESSPQLIQVLAWATTFIVLTSLILFYHPDKKAAL